VWQNGTGRPKSCCPLRSRTLTGWLPKDNPHRAWTAKVRHPPKSEKPLTSAVHSNWNRKGQESSAATSIVRLKKILVPIDFSDCSKKALQYANTFAKQFGGELILIHVVEPYPLVPEMASYDYEDVNDSCQDLQAFQKVIDKAIPSSISTRTGTPHIKIVEAARGLGVDLIIISTHGRKGLDRMFMGSTTEKSSALLPVLCSSFATANTTSSATIPGSLK
jgi:universal stress protein A